MAKALAFDLENSMPICHRISIFLWHGISHPIFCWIRNVAHLKNDTSKFFFLGGGLPTIHAMWSNLTKYLLIILDSEHFLN